MTPYEKEQLEKIAKKCIEDEATLATWITAIQKMRDERGIMRQQIYNALNHEKLKDAED